MQTFDVVIIGAGPGGLKCAELLAKSNLSILLLEKNNSIGPKVCAGGLTKKDIAYLRLPKRLIDHSFSSVRLHMKRLSTCLRHKDPLVYTVDRNKLGQRQYAKLRVYPNIQARTGAMVTHIDKEYIVVNGEKIAYTYLVGADGASSCVRKYLGLPNKNIGLAMQYLVPNQQYLQLELFFDSQVFATGYGRIFPHKNYVSIGCGADPRYVSPHDLKKDFHGWLEQNNIDISQGKYEASLIHADYQGYIFGNIFLVGDAAGLTSELTGEGIYPALISGEEVAKHIMDPQYISSKMPELLRIKSIHHRLMRIIIKAGKRRNRLFVLGLLLFKRPPIKRKLIKILE